MCEKLRSGFAPPLPPLRYKVLVLVLKRFLNVRGLHETFSGGVGSFLLQLLVICSLQQPESGMESGSAASRPGLAGKAAASAEMRASLGAQLLHFLQTFGLRLNYETVGVSVRSGGRFFAKSSRGWRQSDRPQLLCVENPLDPEHDVGANSFNVGSVRRAFAHGYCALLARLEAAYAGVRGSGLRVLGCVLDVEEEMAER